MTGIPPGPIGPNLLGPPSDFATPIGAQKKRLDAVAVSGFVLSFLGCTVVGAVLGLILGVVGILRTRNSQRRGRGLAIAAIPISILFGTVGVFSSISMMGLYSAMQASKQLPVILGDSADSSAQGASALLELASKEFNFNVPQSQVEAWITQVWEKHGKFVSVKPDKTAPPGGNPDGTWFLNYDAKFVNGNVAMKITFITESITEQKLYDIEVDGVSVRDVE